MPCIAAKGRERQSKWVGKIEGESEEEKRRVKEEDFTDHWFGASFPQAQL